VFLVKTLLVAATLTAGLLTFPPAAAEPRRVTAPRAPTSGPNLTPVVQPVFAVPHAFYLALGDSVAYGIQPDKVTAGLPPSKFDTGYVDVFAARMRPLEPNLRVVNYSCPAESTMTFVSGGCPWPASGTHRLHDPFQGTQMSAALTFLRNHPGNVCPITLSLGYGDVQAFEDACHGSLACARAHAPHAIKEFASRLGVILGRLRSAAPNAEIIVTGLWNNSDFREADLYFRRVNQTMARVTASARGRFADVFAAFNPQGNLARERARICILTYFCSQDDGHPTDAGYRAIAAAVWTASGYKT
jgi:lysophospholipase L1-like esterase